MSVAASRHLATAKEYRLEWPPLVSTLPLKLSAKSSK